MKFCVQIMVSISENKKNLRKKFLKWKEAFESKGLKVDLKKTKVMVSGSKQEIFRSKVDPSDKCSKWAKANSMVFSKCDK